MNRAPAPAKPVDPLNIPLGTRVKEEITGLIGIVGMKSFNSAGNIRYAVQPMGDGTSVPEAIWFDYHTLLIVDAGVSVSVTPITKPTAIRMGEEVKHKISGVKGIVTEMVGFMNGCQHLVVQAKKTTTEDKHFRTEDDVGMWARLGDGLAGPVAKPAAPKVKDPVGGPMIRIARPVAMRR
jgi:hypothetical protein